MEIAVRQFYAFLLSVALSTQMALAQQSHVSKYLGQENRQIKSLSQSDINELRKGAGWGLAKAAELNGVPGPLHILEMAEKINLTTEQKSKIEAIYQGMKAKAIRLGNRLIDKETQLNEQFANRTINQATLEQLVGEIAKIRTELRVVHLSTHLQTPNILTEQQITLYNELRGYKKDPCSHVPEGHDAQMWKMHNGCL